MTVRGAGVMPILHFIMAPMHTVFASPAIYLLKWLVIVECR
jgi:hypothetical protein